MTGAAWAALMIAILVVLNIDLDRDRLTPGRDIMLADAEAKALIIYHQAAVTWGKANPAYVGVIPNGSITMPSGALAPVGAVAYKDATRVASYLVRTQSSALITQLIATLPNDATVGQAAAGFVSSPTSNTVSLPAGVPNGAAVIVSRVP